jgi:opacity protein-like surface antigen
LRTAGSQVSGKNLHQAIESKIMKIGIGIISIGSTCLLAAASSQADSTSRFYLSADAGAAFTQDASVQLSDFGNSGDVKFDTGLRAGLNFGYHVTRSFAVELESGVIWNDVQSIQGNSPDAGASATLYQIPVLANVIYKPWHGAFQPYIGVGCGGAASVFDISNVSQSSRFAPYYPSLNSTDWAFAYQAELGVNYALCRCVDLGLAYKFFGTTSHDWSSNGLELKTDGIITHSITASVTWKF